METFYYNLPNIYRKLSLFCLTRLVCENIFSGLKVTKYEIQKPSTFRTCFVASFGFSRFPSCVINLSHMAFLSQHMFSTWPLFLWPFCWVLWLWLPSKPDNNFENSGGEIRWLSSASRHHFRQTPISRCFLFTRKWKGGVFKNGLEERFQQAPFRRLIIMPGLLWKVGLTEKQVTTRKLRARFLLFAHKTHRKLFYFVRSLLLKCHGTCGMKAVLHISFQNGSHSDTPFFWYLYSTMYTISPSLMKDK